MKKHIRVILICLSLLFLWTACKEKKIKLGKDIHFDKEENIHYGNNPEQVMDLYIPSTIIGKTKSEENNCYELQSLIGNFSIFLNKIIS